MASPLRMRFPRELKNNLGKYLGIFLLMSVTIALTSGFLLAAHSIGVIIDDMPESTRSRTRASPPPSKPPTSS